MRLRGLRPYRRARVSDRIGPRAEYPTRPRPPAHARARARGGDGRGGAACVPVGSRFGADGGDARVRGAAGATSCPFRSSSTTSASPRGWPRVPGDGRTRTRGRRRICSRAGWPASQAPGRLRTRTPPMTDGCERTSDERERASDERERASDERERTRMSVSAPRMSASRPGSSASAEEWEPAHPTHPPAHATHPPTHAGAAGPQAYATAPSRCATTPPALVGRPHRRRAGARPRRGRRSGSWSSCSNRFTARRTARSRSPSRPHSTASQIGDELANAGVVSSGFFFELRATLDGERGDLRAGHVPPPAGHDLQRGR